MFTQGILPYEKITDSDAASGNGKGNARNAQAEIWLSVNDYPEGDGPENIACNGIPFRQGILLDERNVRLMNGEMEVPIAVKILAYWYNLMRNLWEKPESICSR